MKISSTKDIAAEGKLRFMVYGYSGIGKTKLISTIGEKTLVLNTDKGMLTLAGSDIDYVSANTWNEVDEFLKFLRTKECKETYAWVVFDSVSAMADLLGAELSKVKKLTGFEYWNEYDAFVKGFLLFLRDQTTYNTVSIYEAIDKEDDNDIPYKAFGVQGGTGKRIPNFYDEVFSLKLNKEGDRVVQTASTPGWIAKDRSQTLEKFEPANLAAIMKKIRGK